MNILIVANHYAVCSARYAADAFKRLGHTVRHIGPAMGRDIWGLTLPERYVWEPDDNPLEDHWRPDLRVIMDSDPAILDRNLGYAEPTVVWGVDNHVRDYRRPYFYHYFLAHRHVSVMDWREDMTWLPCCYDPVVHTPSSIPYFEREYDVCMIGVMYPQRWALVKRLRDAGLKVLAGMGLVYDGYVQAYHNSRIALCASSNGDLALRVFEGAAMGCCVLSDMVADLVHEDTNTAMGLAGFCLYQDENELLAQALELAREPIGEQAAQRMQRSVQAHTWDARVQTIVDWKGKTNDPKTIPEPGRGADYPARGTALVSQAG